MLKLAELEVSSVHRNQIHVLNKHTFFPASNTLMLHFKHFDVAFILLINVGILTCMSRINFMLR